MYKKIKPTVLTIFLFFSFIVLPNNASAEVVCQIDTPEAMISYVRSERTGKMYRLVDSHEGGVSMTQVTQGEGYGACAT